MRAAAAVAGAAQAVDGARYRRADGAAHGTGAAVGVSIHCQRLLRTVFYGVGRRKNEKIHISGQLKKISEANGITTRVYRFN